MWQPGPILTFIDAFVMGDAEVSLPRMLQIVESSPNKDAALDELTDLPTVYVPGRSTRPARWLTVEQTRPLSVDDRILASCGCRYACRFYQGHELHRPYRPAPTEQLEHAIAHMPKRMS